MASVIGFLREDRATHGEKEVLKRLENGLPPDFDIYVECPIHTDNMHRFPDFIVLSNFGVVVLEVKDWVQVLEFDKFSVKVFQRGGKQRGERNPVLTAREYAIALNEELQKVPALVDERRQRCNVPWGYAVVFPNLPTSVISQMRAVWGENYVLNLDDLEPYRLTSRLKATLPRDATLRSDELRYVRAVINPVVVVPGMGRKQQPDGSRPAVILDEEQERLVVEPVKAAPKPPSEKEREKRQEDLFRSLAANKPPTQSEPAAQVEQDLPSVEEQISQNLSVRLVRGFAGSGKSLVLQQRAIYLAAQHPEWSILALTFNEKPAKKLEKIFKRTGIKAIHFHKLCRQLLPQDQRVSFVTPGGWVAHHKEKYPIIQELGPGFVASELSWMIEMGLNDREAYLRASRKGRGREGRLGQRSREALFQVLQDYRGFLRQQNQYDWDDMPHLALRALDAGQATPPQYDVILIDEAQDFAPSWIQVVRRLLKPEKGLLFLADDPMQSIYRYYSWREKGVPVVGRTRWLRVPYRNTREIYQAAYEVIREDEATRAAIESETGLSIEPDLKILRPGPKPELHRFERLEDEARYIRAEIDRLCLMGYDPEQMIVMVRRKRGLKVMKDALKGTGVAVETFHSLKGLEYEVVFLSQMQETFAGLESDEELSQERRLVYMAMTRSRQHLHLCFEGTWPKPLQGVLKHVK